MMLPKDVRNKKCTSVQKTEKINSLDVQKGWVGVSKFD